VIEIERFAMPVTDNPGASVTNVAEQLATCVCQHYGIQPADLVWIEHYPQCDVDHERFHLVTFKLHPVIGLFKWRDWRFVQPAVASFPPSGFARHGPRLA